MLRNQISSESKTTKNQPSLSLNQVRPHFEPRIGHETMEQALDLVDNEYLILKSLSADGLLRAEIHPNNGGIPLVVVVEFMPDGSIGNVSDFSSKTALKAQFSLAAALKLLHILSSKKLRKGAKTLLASAPGWLLEDYKLQLPLGQPLPIAESGYPVNSICDLQAYWALTDLAQTAAPHWPKGLLACHVLSMYEPLPWRMQRAAMTSILDRVATATKDLRVASRPENRQAFGMYRIKSRTQGSRPYDVLVSSAHGAHTKIQGSCTCPDYRKNALGFCKHLGAALDPWFRTTAAKRLFNKSKPLTGHHLQWVPPLNLEMLSDPLAGIILQVCELKALDPNLAGFFEKKSPGHRGLKLKSVPPLLEHKARNRYLSRFMDCLKALGKKCLIDVALLPILEQELHATVWPAEYVEAKNKIVKALDSLTCALYPYQREGVLTALARGRFLLGDDMGLGKTYQAVAWAEALLEAKIVENVLVVCPSSLKSQWKREWSQISNRRVMVVEGTPEEREAIYRKGESSVLVINYELLLKDLDQVKKFATDAIILDEAQRIKNYATQTAKQVKQLNSRFRLVLTGTPMENRIQDLASLMDWIEPTCLAPGWRLDAGVAIGDGRGQGRKGVQGLSAIRNKIAPYFLRRTRQQVLKQLPPRTDTVLDVEVTEEQLGIHTEYATLAKRLMKMAEARPLTPEQHLRLMSYMTNMRIVSNGLAQYEFEDMWTSIQPCKDPTKMLDKISSPKLSTFRGVMEGLLGQKDLKIVVFSQWQRMLRLAHWAVGDVLAENGCEAVFFTGSESQKRRNENIIRFHDDPEVRVFFATDAGGVGLNLQKAASVCINLELPWNPAVLEQRIGRVYRLGQELPVQIYNLITRKTIEERITQLVGTKKAVFDALFDGTTDGVIFDEKAGFYSQFKVAVEEMTSEVGVVDGEAEGEGEDLDEAKDLPPLNDDVPGTSEPLSSNAQDIVHSKIESGENPNLAFSDFGVGLREAFSGIRVTKSDAGEITVRAAGKSAALLSQVFRGMGDMFAGL